ncbi:hypothetical protein B0T16DRAFT_217228 [Cercophora newfieldiana]|uniref:Uncharacterized protein n=1 Tax=Cercophora newfieldiana TaxID=92897 RepID=A0AA39XYY3_9PEZI|nr:hypothetical protein B0T16DRAFT_217228 [Cercophora newfieldiana]
MLRGSPIERGQTKSTRRGKVLRPSLCMSIRIMRTRPVFILPHASREASKHIQAHAQTRHWGCWERWTRRLGSNERASQIRGSQPPLSVQHQILRLFTRAN